MGDAEKPPTTYHLPPITYHLPPTTYHLMLISRFISLVVAVAVATIALQVTTDLGFSSLGKTPGDPSWSYVIALGVTLGISGLGAAISTWFPNWFGTLNRVLSGVASGALVGFYYGGIWADRDPQMAVKGAVIGGVVLGIVQVFGFRQAVIQAAVGSAATVMSYALALLLGTWAIAAFAADRGSIGGGCSAVSLFYFICTVRSFGSILGDRSRFHGLSSENPST